MRVFHRPALYRETVLLLERFGLFPHVRRWAVKLNRVGDKGNKHAASRR